MATLQQSFTWIVYAVMILLLMLTTGIFATIYQHPRERSAGVTAVTIITLTFLLATVLLLPVDIAIVSSTVSSKLGRKHGWANDTEVNNIILGLKIIYYLLYSIDAILCLVVVPFTYFWYEENSDEEENKPFGRKFWDAFKYTLAFIVFLAILFIVGFLVPTPGSSGKDPIDFDYFKKLFLENRGERALTFAIGLLMTVGTVVHVLYTATGLAFLPVSLIKTAPGVSAPSLLATTESALEINREQQHQLEARNEGREGGLSTKDQRQLDQLIREERTLVRRQRLANEAAGEGQSSFMQVWTKLKVIFRPFTLLGGILLLLLTILVAVSMLITGIDKAKNSVCKSKCGYILGNLNIFNPLNALFLESSKIFPMDYILVTLLVIILFTGAIIGLSTLGIRFLWIKILTIRLHRTNPQALLISTEILALIVFAINYALVTIIAPQYATFGSQTYCDKPIEGNSTHLQPICNPGDPLIRPCSEVAKSLAAGVVCTPSVVSTVVNRVTANFPFFGVFNFWAQFAFIGVYLVLAITALFRTPKLDMNEIDADAEEDEEEGLLSSTGRRLGATWEDITGRAPQHPNPQAVAAATNGDT